jgi:hypothetical protein
MHCGEMRRVHSILYLSIMPVFQPICRSFHGSQYIYTCYSNSTDAVPMKSRNSPCAAHPTSSLQPRVYAAIWENGSMFRCFIGRLCFIFLRFTTTHLNPYDPISVIQLQENWTSKYHWIDFKFYLSRGFVVSCIHTDRVGIRLIGI